MSTKWHTLNTEECAEALNSIIEKGLSKQEAQERLTTQGENILEQANTRPWWKVCLLYTSPSPRDQRGSRMPSSA